LSVEDRKGTVPGEIPKWEAELWSYVGEGDGEGCPIYDHCQFSKGVGWCPGIHRDHVNHLLDKRGFTLGSLIHLPSEYEGRVDCRLFKLLEKLSWKFLRRGKADSSPVPTSLVALFDDDNPVDIREVPIKMYHGAIWHQLDGWVIHLNRNDSSAIKRFTVFHEGFHILAHIRTSPVFRRQGSDLGSFNEMLADYFASCMLMPKKWVVERWAEVQNLDTMAETFDVPKPVMCVKLRECGLI
jgi:Zn-dependent peptidase ImmA (M78 family)